VLTGGRTGSRRPLPLEALVSSVPGARLWRGAGAHQAVLELCRRPQSVAEVAARLGIPLGVARVVVDDLRAANAVVVHTGGNRSGWLDPTLLRQVRDALSRL
jgi:hypothetical protein